MKKSLLFLLICCLFCQNAIAVDKKNLAIGRVGVLLFVGGAGLQCLLRFSPRASFSSKLSGICDSREEYEDLTKEMKDSKSTKENRESLRKKRDELGYTHWLNYSYISSGLGALTIIGAYLNYKKNWF